MRKRSKKRTTVKVVQSKKNSEMTRLGAALRALGGLGGGLAGGLIGAQSSGVSVGTSLGASLSRWLGSGDYQVTSNSLVAKGSAAVNMMHKTSQNIIVRHREYIADVVSGTPGSFNINAAFSLNPGLASSYPWLAPIASAYQEYTVRGMIYHYVPTSGESVASTSTGLGSVIMATNYRSTATTYTSKTQMLNEFFSSDAKPSEPFCHPIECDPRENPYNVQYVRTTGVPAGEDPKTYDLATVTIANQGYPTAGVTLGELWVTYEVELRKPVSNSLSDPLASYAHYNFAGPTGAGGNPFNSPVQVVSTLSAPVTFAGNVLTLPPNNGGTYLFVYHAPTTAATLFSVSWASSTNLGLLNLGPSSVGTSTLGLSASTITSTLGSSGMAVGAYTVNNPNNSSTLSLSFNFAGVVAGASLYIFNIPTLSQY